MDKIGKYILKGSLGKGGMGEVYKAHDPVIDRTVAIKVVSEKIRGQEELKQRFLREARSAGKLSHENITVVYDTGEIDGQPFIVMEYLEGVDLKSLIHNRAPLDLATKLGMAIQICRGLQFAHEHKIVHRDIKPDNIKVTVNNRIKIMDFGIARLEASELTRDGHLLGTPAYMAPEQFTSDQVDHRTDIFSFGTLFQELLCYHRPFPGEMTTNIIYQIVHEAPEPLQLEDEELAPELQAIVGKCLEKKPDDRYQSCNEVSADIEKVRRKCRPAKEWDPLSWGDGGVGTSTPSEGTTIHNLLKKGKALFDEGQYWEARTVFEVILAKSPKQRIANEFLTRTKAQIAALEASLKEQGSDSGNIEVVGEKRLINDTIPITDLEKKPSHKLTAVLLLLVVSVVAGWLWLTMTPADENTAEEPPVPEVAAEPEPVPDEAKHSAEVARNQTAEFKAEALASGAQQWAEPILKEGTDLETQAHLAFSEGRYAEAGEGFGKAEAKYRQAMAEAGRLRNARSLDELKTVVADIGAAIRRTRADLEEAGALTKARDLYSEGLAHEQKGERAFQQGDREALLEAQKEFSAARGKYADAGVLIRKIDLSRAKAIQAQTEMNNAKNLLPESPSVKAHPKLKRGDQLAENGKGLFQKGDYDQARLVYVQAEQMFREVGQDILLELEEKARAAKTEMERAKAGADPGAASFREGLSIAESAEQAWSGSDFNLAEQRFNAAAEKFKNARPAPVSEPVAAEPEPESGTPAQSLDFAIHKLAEQYDALLSKKDVQGLARLMKFSRTDEQGWEAFFESADQVRAQTTPGSPQMDGETAHVRVSVALSYHNNRNNSNESRNFEMTWHLRRQDGEWTVFKQE